LTTKEKRYYDSHHEEILRKKREYREKNREKIRQRERERYKQNPEKFKQKSKKFREDNPEKIQKYKEENHDKILERNREYNRLHAEEKKLWYQKNKDRVQANIRKYREEHPEVQRRCNKNYVIKTRDKLFEIVGGKLCTGCGETDDRCLQFDHKNGGGCKDLKKHGSSREMYRYYIAHPDIAKEVLEVKCANCNWKKKFDNNESTFKFPPLD